MSPFRPRARGSSGLVFFFSVIWLLLFVYHEHIVPIRTAQHCSWAPVTPPEQPSSSPRVQPKESISSSGRFPGKAQSNILFVADPQLIDNHTYPGRNEALLAVSKHTVDVYLKQNYRAMVNHLKPDYIMFLGDYLDNGRSSSDKYYETEFQRFERIFNRWPGYHRGERWLTNIPGNHDVGFGNGVKSKSSSRFTSHFGEPNTSKFVNGVEFVFLDTVSLSASDPSLRRDSDNFLRLINDKLVPRVLLSHVPFYRDTNKLPCGPLRENPRFSQNAGYQYQSALDPKLSEELLRKLQPDLIFSGDDHDYCDVQHPDSAREITVKSISMAMGINYPAVQLLSYVANDTSLSYDTHICYLPRPYTNIAVYVAMAVTSGLTLLFHCIRHRRSNYTASASDFRPVADLEEGSITAEKISRFMNTDDSKNKTIKPLSNYTYTSASRSRAFKVVRAFGSVVSRFLRRWNLLSFLKQCGVLGSIVIGLYMATISFI